MTNRVQRTRSREGEPHPAHGEALEIGQRLIELIDVVHASRDADPARSPVEEGERGAVRSSVSPHAIRAAMHLWRAGTLTVSELADGLGISLGWASRVVSELEATGMAVRTPDPMDRRVVRVSLSSNAIDVVERAYLWRAEAIDRALAPLDLAGRDAVRRFLGSAIEEFQRAGRVAREPVAADEDGDPARSE